MKQTNGQKAPANMSAGSEFNAEQWSALQFAAKRREITVDAVLAERASKETVMVNVSLPAAFVRLLKKTLEVRTIPEAHLARGLASALLAVPLEDDCDLWAGYIYLSRSAAQVAAFNVFARNLWMSSLVLKYERDGKTVDEVFRNQLRKANAA